MRDDGWERVNPIPEFIVDDSGDRELFDSGMQRDTETGKTDYTYTLTGPMLRRWAEHMAKGAEKYDRDNWTKATGQAELDRFRRSAMRHLVQWLTGEETILYDDDGEAYSSHEDHAAAIFFNVNGAEFVREVMDD